MYTSSYAAPSPAPLSCSRSCAVCWLRPPAPPPPPPPLTPPTVALEAGVLAADDDAASLPDNALRAPLPLPAPSAFSRLCRKLSSLQPELACPCAAIPRACVPLGAPPLATLLEDERREEEDRALEGRGLALGCPLPRVMV